MRRLLAIAMLAALLRSRRSPRPSRSDADDGTLSVRNGVGKVWIERDRGAVIGRFDYGHR